MLVLGSCSVYKKNNHLVLPAETVTGGNPKGNSIIENNLSQNSFMIADFELNIHSGNSNERLNGTLKKDLNFNHLIVLRSFAGIEILRILVKIDSVYFIDRINKKYYSGSSLDLERIAGFSIILLPLLYGDIVFNYDDSTVLGKLNSANNKFDSYIEGKRLELYTDSSLNKLNRVIVLNSLLKTLFEFKYSDFKKVVNVIYPSYIKVSIEERNLNFGILLKKLQYPWKGVIGKLKNPGYVSEPIN